MAMRTVQYPRVYGVRLSVADSRKLQLLMRHMQRPASEVLRMLVRLAEPVDVAPVTFAVGQAGKGNQS
jgi:hypothetical protein